MEKKFNGGVVDGQKLDVTGLEHDDSEVEVRLTKEGELWHLGTPDSPDPSAPPDLQISRYVHNATTGEYDVVG